MPLEGESAAKWNAPEIGDEPLQDDAVVVAVVVDHLQGQLLWELLGLGLLSGGRWLTASPVQSEGEATVSFEGSLDVGW